MFKKINNWHLSILVLVASVFSLVLVQQHVFAQWVNPTDSPGQAGDNSLVLNPFVENVDLNGYKFTDSANATFVLEPGGSTGLNITGTGYGIRATGATYAGYFSGDLHVTGDLTVDGSAPGASIWVADTYGIHYDAGLVGINGPSHSGFKLALYSDDQSDILKLNPGLVWGYGTDLELRSSADVFTDQDFGIGTNDPNPNANGNVFHVFDNVNNAEIDIQSLGTAGSGDHWGIYQEGDSADANYKDLIFWNGGTNRVFFTDDGRVAINTNSPAGRLHVYDASGIAPIWTQSKTDAASMSVFAMKSSAVGAPQSLAYIAAQGPFGYGGSTIAAGVYGISYVSGGMGIYGAKGTGSYAGYFEGDVVLNHTSGEPYNYIRLDHTSATVTAPPTADCTGSTETKGRMIYVYENDRLYICDDAGWKYTTLSAAK